MYRRGRWTHSPALSIGVLPNRLSVTRIGLRTRRGLKGAVERNRLKRQLRAIIARANGQFRSGLDLVVVAHPRELPARAHTLEQELVLLCRKHGAIR